MRRNLILLTMCQALLLTGGVVLASTSALVGSHLASNQSLATVPLAVFNIGVMVTALPASMLMKRVGRRWGFAFGGVLGVVGATIAALGVQREEFVLFCGGLAVLGAFMAFGGFYRFAAAEVATPVYKSRAIAYVTGGGLVAAFAGTWLSMLTQNVRGLPEFSISYIVIAGTATLTIVLAMMLDVPTPTAQECARCGRPLLEIARQPEYVVAALAASLGYFAMGMIMNAAPLAMRAHALRFGVIALVIQWHVAAMFAPSFVSGPLISHIGVRRVLGLGCAFASASVIINLLGAGTAYFWFGLVALGVGWNFLYIGGTTLLTRTYSEEERSKSQGFNDLFVYSSITIAAFVAGVVHDAWGWSGVNLAAVPAIAVVSGALVWLGRLDRPAEPS